jgi:hypothetical protein
MEHGRSTTRRQAGSIQAAGASHAQTRRRGGTGSRGASSASPWRRPLLLPNGAAARPSLPTSANSNGNSHDDGSVLGRRATRAPAVGRALPSAGGAELDYAVEKGALSPVRDPPWRRCLEGGPELLLLECWRRPSRSSTGGAGGAAAFAPAVRCPFPPSSSCSCSYSPPADVPWPRATVDPDLRPLLSCPTAAEQERGAQVAAVHVADSPGGAEVT